MAALRATNFFAGAVSGAGPVNLYTVPSGHRIILRSINLYNEATTSNPVTIAIPGFPTITALVLAGAGGPGSTYNLQPWVVLGPGATIAFFGVAGKSCSIILSGSLLFI